MVVKPEFAVTNFDVVVNLEDIQDARKAIAPVMENKRLSKGKHVVSVVTGGNIDSDLFQSILTSER